MKKLSAIATLVACMMIHQAAATVTILVSVADLQDQNGALTGSNAIALLVADTSGLGLAGLTNLAVDSSLALGAQLTQTGGTPVGQIVGKWTIAASSLQNGMLTDVAHLTLDPPLASGQNLWLLWFPSLTSSSTQPGSGTYFGVYRDPNSPPIDGGEPWVIPSDGSTVTLAAHSTSQGGNTPQSSLRANYRTPGGAPGGPDFAAAAGSYQGLVRSDPATFENSGLIQLRLTAAGTFKAKLLLGGISHSFSGQFDSLGGFNGLVPRAGLSTLNVELQLDTEHGAGRVRGTISDGITTSEVLANQGVFNKSTRPASAYAGLYTLIFPPDPSDSGPDFPQGIGYATLLVDLGGRVKLSGVLGDGTKLRQRSFVSKDGTWPLHALLYGKRGSISGWAAITNGVADTDIEGTVHWIKPAVALTPYQPNGFETDIELVGSRYSIPPPGMAVLNVTNTACNAVVMFAEGNLDSSLTNSVTLDPANKVTLCDPATLTMKFALKTGMFQGAFLHPAMQKSAPFRGVVLQQHNVGAGHFLGSNQSGAVVFEPTP